MIACVYVCICVEHLNVTLVVCSIVLSSEMLLDDWAYLALVNSIDMGLFPFLS